jgi:hypothetical protein
VIQPAVLVVHPVLIVVQVAAVLVVVQVVALVVALVVVQLVVVAVVLLVAAAVAPLAAAVLRQQVVAHQVQHQVAHQATPQAAQHHRVAVVQQQRAAPLIQVDRRSNVMPLDLIMSDRPTQHSIWGRNLLFHLMQHPDINTKIIPLPRINVHKNKHFTYFILNDILFIMDDWDHATPTCYLIGNDNAFPSFYKRNNTVILKIQYSPNQKHIYDAIENQFGIKVLPFTMFANHSFNLANFEWKLQDDYEYDCIFTGRPWNCRHAWMKFAENNQDKIKCNVNYNLTTEFDNLLQKTKWGVILKGKGDGGKNRREVEYSSFGMPLALNYIPYYHFPFEPNIDYVLLEKPEDLLKLKDIDPAPFAQRSKEIYHNYFSPQNGVYNSFKLAYSIASEYFDKPLKPIDFSEIIESNIIQISAGNSMGSSIGPIKQNTSITFKYRGGAWKCWGGKGNINPDNTGGRGGDQCRLALYSSNDGQLELITIIPEHTAQNPFTYVADKNFNNLILRIFNSDHRWYKKRGNVSYKVIIKDN